MTVVSQVRRVRLRPNLRPANVAQLHQRPGSALQDYVFEFLRIAQSSRHTHADLELLLAVGRRLPHRSRGYLYVLLAKRAGHVLRCQSPLRQLERVEPQTHRVLAFAKDDDVADPRDTLQGIDYVYVEVVADEQRVVPVAFSIEAGCEYEVPGVLRDGDAGRLHVAGQSCHSGRRAILYVNRRD